MALEILKQLVIFFRENREIIYLVVAIIGLFVERWLGKTDKVQAGSILEAIENKLLKGAQLEEKEVENAESVRSIGIGQAAIGGTEETSGGSNHDHP